MKVILTEDIEDLGKMGDVVIVKDGYARNFLFPGKKAQAATPENLKRAEFFKKKRLVEETKRKEEADALADRLQKVSLTVNMLAGDEEKLFGSVTAEMIAELLHEEGFTVDKKDITIDEPIKKLGVFSVTVKVHPEVKASVKLWVVKK